MRDSGMQIEAFRSTELGTELPSAVLVAPWGEVVSANGTFVVDEEAGTLVIAAFESQATDIPVDYEHQTLGGRYASPTGQAPAAGWIRRLVLRQPGESDAPGLYAEVAWTEPAARQIAARQYRYLSPVAIVRKSDRRAVALHSVALTNKPAIVGMRAIVNGARGAIAGRTPLDPPLKRGELGYPSFSRGEGEGRSETAHAEKEVLMAEGMERLRMQLGIEAASDAEDVLAAACERLAMMEADVHRRDAEERAVAAMKAGKLTESQREWATALAMKDMAAFEAWEATAPVVVCTGRIMPESAAGSQDGERNVITAKARVEFRSHPELALITSEDAYVTLAMRDAGMGEGKARWHEGT